MVMATVESMPTATGPSRIWALAVQQTPDEDSSSTAVVLNANTATAATDNTASTATDNTATNDASSTGEAVPQKTAANDETFKTNCVPALVLLLGFEMHLVLRQRLESRNVPSDEVQQVLQGIVESLLGFVEHNVGIHEWILNDDPLPGSNAASLKTLKEAMTRIIHSSIVRLNQTSMDRLFDLMLMGAKRHVFYAESSAWICEIIHEQLDWLAGLLFDNSEVDQPRRHVVQALEVKLSRFYLDQYEGVDTLYKELNRVLAVKEIKVSLLLEKGIQADDGMFKADASSEAKYRLNLYGKEDGPDHAKRVEQRRNKLQKQGHRCRMAIDDARTSVEAITIERNAVMLEDATTCKGEVVGSQPHDRATLRYPNGDVYVGHFAEGLPHGHGVLYCADGSEWHGPWHRGHKHGVGVHVGADGRRDEGEWADGEKLALGVRRTSAATVEGSGNLHDLRVENVESPSLFHVVVEREDDGADVKEERLAPLQSQRRRTVQLPLDIEF